jgi:PhnB protein
MHTCHLGPYINFQGRAREAMEFYRKILGGSLDLQTVDTQGSPRPAGPGDRITDARLESDGIHITASDGHPDYPATVGENMGIALRGTDRDRLTGVFNSLAEGGSIKMPLTKAPWGEAGWVQDKFGITWSVNVESR